MDRWLSVKTASNRLTISLSMTYVLIKSGQLVAVRHAKRRDCRGTLRVSEQSLLDYIERSQVSYPTAKT
jgi:hypothetical protein